MKAEEIFWLTYNVYNEARGEPFPGKVAVCHVTLNRLENWGVGSAEAVIRKPYQFSWHNGGRLPIIKDILAFENCAVAVDVCIAERAQGKRLHDCDHYFRYDIPRPKWSLGMMFYERIGDHLFFISGR